MTPRLCAVVTLPTAGLTATVGVVGVSPPPPPPPPQAIRKIVRRKTGMLLRIGENVVLLMVVAGPLVEAWVGNTLPDQQGDHSPVCAIWLVGRASFRCNGPKSEEPVEVQSCTSLLSCCTSLRIYDVQGASESLDPRGYAISVNPSEERCCRCSGEEPQNPPHTCRLCLRSVSRLDRISGGPFPSPDRYGKSLLFDAPRQRLSWDSRL